MRTRTFILSLSLVLLLAVATAVAAVAGGDGDAKETDRTLYAVEDEFTWITADGTVDPGEDSLPGPGDRFVAVDLLFSDEDHDDEVGRNDVSCTITEAGGEGEDFSARLVCHGVVTLDGEGSLAWQGSADATEETDEDEPFITVGLTGGTDDFVAAGGEVEVFDTTDEGDDEASARYEITLLDLRRR